MPPRKTCVVVKRSDESGAKIHPRGCRVRREVQYLRTENGRKVYDDANMSKTNKQGQQKVKVKAGAQGIEIKSLVRINDRHTYKPYTVDSGAQGYMTGPARDLVSAGVLGPNDFIPIGNMGEIQMLFKYVDPARPEDGG